MTRIRVSVALGPGLRRGDGNGVATPKGFDAEQSDALHAI